jgi:hypothetical protein
MNILYTIFKYGFCVVFGLFMFYRVQDTKENEHLKTFINFVLFFIGITIIGIISGKLDM